MNKQTIIRGLEMDQIEYLDSVLSQLDDNIDGLNCKLRKYEKSNNEVDLLMFISEYQHLRERHESMLGISKKLLSEIHENVETAKIELYKLEVEDD